MSRSEKGPNIDTGMSNLDEWHFVSGWWPVPRFLFLLLGESGCHAFVESLSERQPHSRIRVSFALAIEHCHAPICSDSDLAKSVANICAPGYDFGTANSLQSAVSDAKWAHIVHANKRALEEAPLTNNTPEALKRSIAAKRLPSGRSENIALIRAILKQAEED